MKVDSPVYKGIDKNLYKEIMLNAAEHYGWDKSSVTDEYISDAYQKTGGDVNKYLRRIFESGGDNPEVVTQAYVVELLDRHGVVDKINTPRTSSFLKSDEASEGVPNKVTDVWVDNFYVPEDKGTKEDIKFSVRGAVDSIDEYYNGNGDLTPVQKEAIANRRFGNAYREVLEKYGNTAQAAQRVNEEANRIINDLRVVYKDGRFVANDADRKAYDMYFTAAMVNPKDYNQVFRRDEVVKSRVDVAKELNDEFERNFYKPSMGITGGEPLRVTPGSEIAVASGLLYESGVNEAPKLFNDATIKLYAKLEQAKRDNAVVNFAKGTGKGFWNHFADMVTEMQDFGRNAAATGLNKKIDSIQEELRKERPFEEVPPEVDNYNSLEDYMVALRQYESDQKKYNNEISLAAYQQLTPKEQNLINSAANYYGAVQEVSKEIPNSRNMGKVFGGSLGYMVEFMGTGGSGWIKGAAKAGLSGLAKAAARRGAKSLARGLAGAGERIAVEAGEQVAKNIPQKIAGWVKEKPWQAAEAAVQSVVMPSFYKEVGDRISQGENPTSAFVGSLYDTWTENFSERFFVGGGKVGRFTGSAIDWGKVKGLKGVARLAGNNLEEYAEELVGDFLRRLPEWADKNWTQAYGDYWDDKWDTLVNVSLMTGMLGGAAEISNSGPVSKLRNKWNADIYRKAVPEMLANNIDELIESGDISSQEASETIGNLVEASSRANNIPIGKLTGDVVRYVTARQKQKGFELFTNSAENTKKSINLAENISDNGIRNDNGGIQTESSGGISEVGIQRAGGEGAGGRTEGHSDTQSDRLRGAAAEFGKSDFSHGLSEDVERGIAENTYLQRPKKSNGRPLYEPTKLREASVEEFVEATKTGKLSNPHGAFVDIHTPEEYKKMKVRLLSEDGKSGIAVEEDGNIVNLFSSNSSTNGASTALFLAALAKGGIKGDNFGLDLTERYVQMGAIPVARVKFNDEFAPDDWNYERDGRPDIIFWMHNGESASDVAKKIGSYEEADISQLPLFDSYDEAAAYRDRLLKERDKGNEDINPVEVENNAISHDNLKKRLDSIVSDYVENEKNEIRKKEQENTERELEEIRWNISRKGIIVDVDGRRVRVSRTKKGGYNTKNEKAIAAFEQELDKRVENEKPKVNAAMEKRISDYNEVIDEGAMDFRRKLEEGNIARTRTMEARVQDSSVSLNQAGEIKRKVKEAYNQGKGEVIDKINSVRSALSAYRGLGQLSDKQYKNILKKLSRKNADIVGILDNIDNMIVDNAFRERAYAAKIKQQKQADVIRKKISKMMLPDWLGHDVMEQFIALDTDNMNVLMLDQYEGMMDDLAKPRPKFSRFIPDFIDKYDEIGVEDVAPKKSKIEVDLEGLQDRIKGINSRIGSNGKLSEASVGKVNSQFNEKLDELTEENAERLVLSLGVPNSILRSAGISDKPMKLYGNKVIKKMKKHGFALSELRNLPEAVADPIAVFDNLGRAGNRSILTELRTKQGNFLVTVDLGKDADVDFNIISSVFGKGDNNIVHWINKGFATYINKEKARSFLSHQSAPIAAAAANEELSSATNIVKNFENPIAAGEESAGIKTIAAYRNVNREVSRLKSMASRWYEEELGKIEEDSDGYEERVKAVGDSYQRLLDDIEGVQDRLKDVSVNLKKDLIQGIWGKDGSGMLRETMEGAGLEGSPFEEVLQEIKRFGVDLKGFENLEIKDLMNLETALFNASIGVPTRDLFTVWSKLKANEMGKRLVVSREKIERAGENKRVRRLLDNLEKLKDVVDMHDFSMVDAIFDAGSGKDLYENFFVPQIERAVVRMDKEKALALKEFGESMQKLENYFVLSRLSSGTPLKRLMRGDVQRCRDLAGMIMTQLDYESNVSVPFEELPDGLKDYFGNVIGKANVPKDLRKRTKAAYQFMRFGEDGRLDIEKTLEALKDKELAGILKEVMGVARRTLDGSMKQYSIANAVRRGVNIKMMDNYFPRFVRKGLAAKTDGEIDFQHIYASGRLMPTMLPGSMNKRVTKAMPNPVEIDIARVMRRAADETLTDYFLAPAFAQANSALIGVQKDGGKAAGAFEVLREAMKDRLIKNYRREISKDDLSFVKDLDRVVAKMARTLLLAKIPKTVAEFASNQVGSLISDGTAGWSYWGKINVLHELADAMNLTSAKNIVKYNEMYRDATGGKMSLGEKGVNKLITINDEWTSSAIYYKTFNKLFEKYSGQKFDYKKAQTDEKYRRWAIEDHEGERSYFERAYIGALTRAQESFTTVNRALGATHTRFLPGKGKIDVDSFAGRAFGFMMSFNTNERFEFVRGAREFGTGIRTGNKQLIRDGLGRMASRFVRGAVYAGFMQEIGSLIASGFRDDKDPEWSVNPNLLAGTCIQLALGRYGNTGGMLLNFGLGALKWWDKKVNGNTALTKSVVSAINDGAGIYAVPLSTDMPTLRTIEKVFPHWGFMTRIVTDSPEMAYDVYKKLEKGEELSDDEQMLWGSISLMNAVLTMLYPNPVTTTGFNVSRTVEGSYKRDKYEKRDSVGQVLQRKPGQRSQTLVTRGR